MDSKPFFVKLTEGFSCTSGIILDLRTVIFARRQLSSIELHLSDGSKLENINKDDAEAIWGILSETARTPQDIKGGRQLEAYP